MLSEIDFHSLLSIFLCVLHCIIHLPVYLYKKISLPGYVRLDRINSLILICLNFVITVDLGYIHVDACSHSENAFFFHLKSSFLIFKKSEFIVIMIDKKASTIIIYFLAYGQGM